MFASPLKVCIACRAWRAQQGGTGGQLALLQQHHIGPADAWRGDRARSHRPPRHRSRPPLPMSSSRPRSRIPRCHAGKQLVRPLCCRLRPKGRAIVSRRHSSKCCAVLAGVSSSIATRERRQDDRHLRHHGGRGALPGGEDPQVQVQPAAACEHHALRERCRRVPADSARRQLGHDEACAAGGAPARAARPAAAICGVSGATSSQRAGRTHSARCEASRGAPGRRRAEAPRIVRAIALTLGIAPAQRCDLDDLGGPARERQCRRGPRARRGHARSPGRACGG